MPAQSGQLIGRGIASRRLRRDSDAIPVSFREWIAPPTAAPDDWRSRRYLLP
jgi:hypothetical protein